jgi:hypothetical protein
MTRAVRGKAAVLPPELHQTLIELVCGAAHEPRIEGPPYPDSGGDGWVVFLPDTEPCICESLDDAVEYLKEWEGYVPAKARGRRK